MPFPFEVSYGEVEENIDAFVDEVFGALQSEFLNLPKGQGFIEYSVFSKGYEELKTVTKDFRDLSPEPIVATIQRTPISFIVLRTILGFTPPEWAYITMQRSNVEIPQGAARSLDRNIRMAPLTPLKADNGLTNNRLGAMVATACQLLIEDPPEVPNDKIYRLDKADTKSGIVSLQPLADLGVPYAMLLYERFLGRPFGGHRDSVSELIGDILESAIEMRMMEAVLVFVRPSEQSALRDSIRRLTLSCLTNSIRWPSLRPRLLKTMEQRVIRLRACSISVGSPCRAVPQPIHRASK